jgi:hypothetical protein
VIKLLTFWAAWRLARALAAIVVVATLALLLLGGMNHIARRTAGAVARLQHATRPLELQLQHALGKVLGP